MPLKDPQARRAYHRDYQRRRFREDPEAKRKHLAIVRRGDMVRQAAVDELIRVFRARGCVACGESDACCLTAHHRDPTGKEFDIGNGRRKKKSEAAMAAELSKCVCLCMNCHAKVHAGRIRLPM